MPYDSALADRLRPLCPTRAGFVEKTMFGGVCFLLHGNLCLGVWRELLIVRVGPDEYEAALGEPYAREFDVTGRPMRGWVMVEPDGIESGGALERWVDRAVQFVRTLPRKT